jgi:hypothetical protein
VGLFAAVALASATSASAGPIINGGFETGNFTGWNISGSAPCTAVGNALNNGNSCVPQYTLAPHGGTYEAAIGDIPTSIYQDVTTSAILYNVSFWLANSPLGPAGGGFVPVVASWGGIQILSIPNFVPQPYTQFSFTLMGKPGTTRLEIGTAPGQIPPNYGSLLIDDVTVSVPDGGMTLMLLGGALAGVGVLRRKFSA